jgi:hypothetical protein
LPARAFLGYVGGTVETGKQAFGTSGVSGEGFLKRAPSGDTGEDEQEISQNETINNGTVTFGNLMCSPDRSSLNLLFSTFKKITPGKTRQG